MKKLPKYLSTFAFALAVWGAFLVPSGIAQGAVLLQQPNGPSVSSSPTAGQSWVFNLGQGNIIGSVTGVSLNYTGTAGSVGTWTFFTVNLTSYSDSGYVTQIGDCQMRRLVSPSTSESGLLPANDFSQSGVGCSLAYNSYIKMSVSGVSSGFGANSVIYGVNQSVPPLTTTSNNTDLAVPQFIIEGVNASLDPNLINSGNPSGVSTSTIQTYCSSSYSTSTGLFSDLSNAVTYGTCTAFAFLFVPNQDTLQDFSDLSSTTRSKIPFSYGYDIAGIFTGLNASTSQNFPTFTIGLGAIDFASSTAMGSIFPSNLDFLSTTTINRFLPAGMHDLLYNFAIFVIWVEVAFVLYRKVMPTKAKI